MANLKFENFNSFTFKRMSTTPETTSPTERLGKHRKDSIRFQQFDILKEEWFPVFKQGNETQEPIGLILPLPTYTGFI